MRLEPPQGLKQGESYAEGEGQLAGPARRASDPLPDERERPPCGWVLKFGLVTCGGTGRPLEGDEERTILRSWAGARRSLTGAGA